MRWSSPLVEEFNRLKAESDRHRRGIEFQALVVRMFQAAHFKVVPNSGVAQPRQTDLLATIGSDAYLVETKWTHARSDVNDVDSLRTRLSATPSSVVGVLVSVAGFSNAARLRVETSRDRPILLLESDDLEALLGRTDEVQRLLVRKRQHLLATGRSLAPRATMRPRRTAR